MLYHEGAAYCTNTVHSTILKKCNLLHRNRTLTQETLGKVAECPVTATPAPGRPWPGAARRRRCYAVGMHPIALLEPLTWLRHDPAKGFCASPDALVYTGQDASVRFDKSTGRVSLDPPSADVLQLLQELQALASQQEREERAGLLAKLRQRPF